MRFTLTLWDMWQHLKVWLVGSVEDWRRNISYSIMYLKSWLLVKGNIFFSFLKTLFIYEIIIMSFLPSRSPFWALLYIPPYSLLSSWLPFLFIDATCKYIYIIISWGYIIFRMCNTRQGVRLHFEGSNIARIEKPIDKYWGSTWGSESKKANLLESSHL